MAAVHSSVNAVGLTIKVIYSKAVSELAALATAGSLCRHALKHRLPLATAQPQPPIQTQPGYGWIDALNYRRPLTIPLATAVATNSDKAYAWIKVVRNPHTLPLFIVPREMAPNSIKLVSHEFAEQSNILLNNTG